MLDTQETFSNKYGNDTAWSSHYKKEKKMECQSLCIYIFLNDFWFFPLLPVVQACKLFLPNINVEKVIYLRLMYSVLWIKRFWYDILANTILESYIRESTKSIQLCPTVCNPMDCSLPGTSVHGFLQARILEWVAMFFSRASPRPRDRIHVSCTGRWVLYH